MNEPKTYIITIARTGSVRVEANCPEEAMVLADDLPTDRILWDDDWSVTDCQEKSECEDPAVPAD